MNAGPGLDWGICGVGVLPSDRRMQQALTAQDGLYTLVVKHPDGSPRAPGHRFDHRVPVGADDPEAVAEKMADRDTRIVSLTINERGYNTDPLTGVFDVSAPDVGADLQPDAVLRTTFGLITEALARRRSRGLPPFTVLSCDNLQGNGDVAPRAFTAFATLRDPDLGAWVARGFLPPQHGRPDHPVHHACRRGVVPRPVRGGRRLAGGVRNVPRWVVEDRFPTGRPPWEDAGVQLVEDVTPYRR